MKPSPIVDPLAGPSHLTPRWEGQPEGNPGHASILFAVWISERFAFHRWAIPGIGIVDAASVIVPGQDAHIYVHSELGSRCFAHVPGAQIHVVAAQGIRIDDTDPASIRCVLQCDDGPLSAIDVTFQENAEAPDWHQSEHPFGITGTVAGTTRPVRADGFMTPHSGDPAQFRAVPATRILAGQLTATWLAREA